MLVRRALARRRRLRTAATLFPARRKEMAWAALRKTTKKKTLHMAELRSGSFARSACSGADRNQQDKGVLAMRFARKVEFSIKSGHEQELIRIIEAEVLPILQKQTGFQDVLVMTHGREVTAISLWDNRTDAETYEKTVYPNVLELLESLIEGTPNVVAFEVPFTTLHAAV
ncbi:MAG: hypothetical protein ACYSTY_09000 [Planctomycetota bacterium]